MNALSAAACLPEPRRTELLEAVAAGDHREIARRAENLLRIIRGHLVPSKQHETDTTAPLLRDLAELEALPTASKSLPIDSGSPDLIRLQTVRVSTSSHPNDLLGVFESAQPTIRDLACAIAIERFTPPQCRELAARLIGSFKEKQRMSGAILAGLTDSAADDPELIRRLRVRAEHPGSWVVQQHCYLALTMLAKPPEGFDPSVLMQHETMPRTTLIMAMLHMGRLKGLDWLLNPFGEPPVGGVEGLRLLLDYYRYWHVLRRYLRGAPAFSFWADVQHQREQVELLRDWYLLVRPDLRLDAASHTWTANDG